jgi:hypothetical protein
VSDVLNLVDDDEASRKATAAKHECHVDNLAIALCMSVGCAVGWLTALYTEGGAQLLIWNVAFGMVGAALCAMAVAWLAPAFVIPALVTAGPIFSLLAIVVGQAIRRRLSRPA